ncbi:hypothetical protein GUJ93_ZPchr0014g46749 [Zizania palustris]|uniref:Uncharacterized protein n=1 Tax=Zizania palustris TaxID=103762 RepID=A0A8J5W6W5_ZIZPA|nr:hypothetical protein GUJ93_ZPchr0014g46749 [Zizania palustris]
MLHTCGLAARGRLPIAAAHRVAVRLGSPLDRCRVAAQSRACAARLLRSITCLGRLASVWPHASATPGSPHGRAALSAQPRLLRLATRLPPQQQSRSLSPVAINPHIATHSVRANKSPQVPDEAPYALIQALDYP